MNTIDIALHIATTAHAGQLDKDGYPAILHSLAVGLMGHTDEEKVTGFLHDVVEDTSYTFDDLLEAGIPIGIVGALRLLTRDEKTDYDTYIQRIIDSDNPIALHVKYYDLQHNYERAKNNPILQAKYERALKKIQDAVEACSRVGLYQGPNQSDVDVAIFACGCFWGTQHQFAKQAGVIRTLAGYTGGTEEHPTYAEVREHKTHHVEAVIVEFNPLVASYESLCKLFFEIHDPAQTDGVGPDLGPQYRSCIFYRNQFQKQVAEQVMQQLRDMGYEVNTLLLPETKFYTGEAYHQNYYEKTGGEPYCHVRVKKF